MIFCFTASSHKALMTMPTLRFCPDPSGLTSFWCGRRDCRLSIQVVIVDPSSLHTGVLPKTGATCAHAERYEATVDLALPSLDLIHGSQRSSNVMCG